MAEPAIDTPLIRFRQIVMVLVTGLLLVVSVILVVEAAGGTSIAVYFRDPAASFNFTPFAGMISHLGVFASAAAGVICCFSSLHSPPAGAY